MSIEVQQILADTTGKTDVIDLTGANQVDGMFETCIPKGVKTYQLQGVFAWASKVNARVCSDRCTRLWINFCEADLVFGDTDPIQQ